MIGKVILFLLVLVGTCSGQSIEVTKTVGASVDGDSINMFGNGSGNECYVLFVLDKKQLIGNVKFDAYGTSYQGYPEFAVTVDNDTSKIGKTTTTGDWAAYNIAVNEVTDSIYVYFLNDRYDEGIGDRNLYLRDVEIIGNGSSIAIDYIDGWEFTIYEITETPASADTIEKEKTIAIEFIQPLTKSDYNLQKKPVTFEVNQSFQPITFFVTKSDVGLDISGSDSANVSYTKQINLLSNKYYALTIRCKGVNERYSQFSNWKPFIVVAEDVSPGVPVRLKFIFK